MTRIYRKPLVHEAAHVWQHQNGVPYSYAINALIAQGIAAILTGSRNKAYDYRENIKYCIPWGLWNAEQQAQWIEDNEKMPPVVVWSSGGLLLLNFTDCARRIVNKLKSASSKTIRKTGKIIQEGGSMLKKVLKKIYDNYFGRERYLLKSLFEK